jgi:hypothetical protein
VRKTEFGMPNAETESLEARRLKGWGLTTDDNMTATANRRFLGKTWHGRPAMFASICLLALLVFGDVGTALCGTDENSGRVAQVTDESRGAQTKSENAQSAPRDQSAPGSSEPAQEGTQPSDRNSLRRPSSPEKEFKPSEQIDVDKAVDFPADI